LRQAICPVFGKCGGCAYQDMEYDQQLAIKKKEVLDRLYMHHIEPPSNVKIFYKNEYFYRSRMDFIFSDNGLGMREKGKFAKVVNFEKCYISNDGINGIFTEVNSWFFANKEKIDVFKNRENKGTLRYAVIRNPYFSKEASITFILNKDSEKADGHKALIKDFAAGSKVKNILAGLVKHNTDQSATEDYEVIKGSDIIYETMQEMKYYFHTQGFFQNNSPVSLDMLYYIREKLRDGGDTLLDLFGGIGTFGIFLSDAFKETHTVDNNRLNIICARKNLDENRVSDKVRVHEIDAEDIGQLNYLFFNKKSVFVLDPPRVGLHKKTTAFITEVKPGTIIYVSCNPEQLAKDAEALREYYEMKDLAVFDMFPQTKHVESVATFELK